jgi:ornithine cyclodeaminase/alanine dehydrogenase
VLLLRDDEVRAATERDGVFDEMERMLSRPVDSGLELPPRLTVDAADGQGWLRLMPVIAYGAGYAGYKAMNFHPNYGVRYVFAMTSLATGELVALLDANWITAYRTAVTSAIAVRHLARSGAECVAVVGSGTQARALLDATAHVIHPGKVLVYSPTAANRERFAAELGELLDLPVAPVTALSEAVAAADVVLSAFRANGDPVMTTPDELRAGALVCGISSVRPEHREVGTEVWRSSRVVVDDLAHVRESGDGRAATELGLTGADDVAELWQVLRDPALGRRSDSERVLFKSVGTAEQDVALAAIALDNAVKLGLGQDVSEFPSLRPIQSSQVVTTAGESERR